MWTDGWIGPPTSSTSSPDPAAARRNGQPSHRQQQADRPARSAPHRRRLPPPKPAPISTVLMSNLRIAGWVQQDPARGIRLHRSRGASWPVHYMTAQGPHGPASGQRWSQRGPCRPRAQMGSGMAVCGGGNRPGRQQRNARPSSAASAENRSARTLAAALTSLKTAAMGEGRDRDDTVESAWGAVPALLLVRFPRPLAEPGVRLSPHRALHGVCRGVGSHLGEGWPASPIPAAAVHPILPAGSSPVRASPFGGASFGIAASTLFSSPLPPFAM